jgi:hypothetical protein
MDRPLFSTSVRSTHQVFGAAILLLGLWTLSGALINPGIMGDNIEQLIWVHSLEMGYYKHPPMPTWLLGLGVALAGWQWWLTDLTAFFCLAVTALFTYLIAMQLASHRAAQMTVLLWGLQLSTSWRAHHYSHNTPLVMWVAISAWCAIHAAQYKTLRWWMLYGAACGLAMLTKYQAIVSLSAMTLACLQVNSWRDAATWRGIAVAVATGLIVFSPNLVWLIRHDFLPWQYTSRFLDDSAAGKTDLQMALSFSVQQLRFLGLALLAVLLTMLLFRRRPASTHALALASRARVWVTHLTLTPFILVIALGLADVQLQNQWGIQILQFIFVPLVLWLNRRGHASVRQMLAVVLAVHALALSVQIAQAWQARTQGWQGSGDHTYPARQLASAAMQDWQRVTACPLRYVAGPGYEAGIIAAFSGQRVQVFEGASTLQNPWIDPADVRTQGSIVVAYARGQLPSNAAAIGGITLTQAAQPRRPAQVVWAIVPPTTPCAAP